METIKEDMEDKELSIIENQSESTETSPKVAEANDGSEFMMITVGHCRNVVPAPKYNTLGCSFSTHFSDRSINITTYNDMY